MSPGSALHRLWLQKTRRAGGEAGISAKNQERETAAEARTKDAGILGSQAVSEEWKFDDASPRVKSTDGGSDAAEGAIGSKRGDKAARGLTQSCPQVPCVPTQVGEGNAVSDTMRQWA